eukprot:TRINITY_DN14036_c0_g1_i1.p1 TRINITY_DN14036_c0_g1~~TRINITY_DN14036_c0_g1_i1.p1  ORF type:complete len:234 (+),score=11.74 TRINITY_DN14036_c0_g1_i1:216-917(+)
MKDFLRNSHGCFIDHGRELPIENSVLRSEQCLQSGLMDSQEKCKECRQFYQHLQHTAVQIQKACDNKTLYLLKDCDFPERASYLAQEAAFYAEKWAVSRKRELPTYQGTDKWKGDVVTKVIAGLKVYKDNCFLWQFITNQAENCLPANSHGHRFETVMPFWVGVNFRGGPAVMDFLRGEGDENDRTSFNLFVPSKSSLKKRQPVGYYGLSPDIENIKTEAIQLSSQLAVRLFS